MAYIYEDYLDIAITTLVWLRDHECPSGFGCTHRRMVIDSALAMIEDVGRPWAAIKKELGIDSEEPAPDEEPPQKTQPVDWENVAESLSDSLVDLAALAVDLEGLREISKKLSSALLTYGVHDSICEMDGGDSCTCGLTAAKRLCLTKEEEL